MKLLSLRKKLDSFIKFVTNGLPEDIPRVVKEYPLWKLSYVILSLIHIINLGIDFPENPEFNVPEAKNMLMEIRENFSRVHFDAITSHLEDEIKIFILEKDTILWSKEDIDCFKTYLYALDDFQHQRSELSIQAEKNLLSILSMN
jgi:hypothetical protein